MLCAFSRCAENYDLYAQIYVHFQILFCYRLLQNTEYSSLYCIVEPHCLSILDIVLHTFYSQTLFISHSLLTFPFGDHKFVFFHCESVFVSCINLLDHFLKLCTEVLPCNICLSLPDLFHLI